MTLRAAVILAAGGGSRWRGEQHKLLTRVSGAAIIQHTVDAALAAEFSDVGVVQGAVDLREALAGRPVTIIDNPDWASGQASSLIAGVEWVDARGYDAVTVGLGDHLGVPATAWRKVSEARGPLVTAIFDGARRPPVRLAADVWSLLPRTGDEGARVLMRGRPDLVTEIACDGEPLDVDTPEDLTRWS